VTAEDTVQRIAEKYDDEEGSLIAGALRRLAERQAEAGKVCATCGQLLPLSAFGADARRTNGLKSACRACLALGRRSSREAAYASTDPIPPSPEEGPA
jgi:hypothetical protein